MRFMRGLDRATSAVVTAGNRLGAAPASLSAARRALYAQQTREAFAAVLDHALATDARLLVLAGGLFAAVEPALDDLQFVTDALRRVQDQGVSVVALDDAGGDPTEDRVSGVGFLAGLGLLHPLRAGGGAGDAYALNVGDRRLGMTADPTFALPIHERRELDALVLVTRDPNAKALTDAGLIRADIVIMADSATPGFDELDRLVVIRPGWSAPPTSGDAPPAAFAVLSIDPAGRVDIDTVPVPAARTTRLRIAPEDLAAGDPGSALRRRLAALTGNTAALTVRFEGRFARAQWHACRIGALLQWATQQGTLIDLDLAAFELAGADPDRSRGVSLHVELRRAADSIRTVATDSPTDIVDQAQALVTDALARRQIVEAVE